MGRGFGVLLIGFLVFSLGFGTLYSMALGNIYTASNGFSMLAYLGNGWGAASALQIKATADFQPQEGIQTPWNDMRMGTVTKQDLETKINSAFIEWLAERGKINELFGAVIGIQHKKDSPSTKSLYALFNQFLYENPKQVEYLKQYDSLLAREHVMTTMVDIPDFDLVIGQGRLVGEWNQSLTINGTQFTVICKQYQLEVNGTLQEVIKASYYNEEGILIMDPDVYKSILPLWIWIGWWPFGYPLYYGEDVQLVIRYRNSFMVPGTDKPVLEALNFKERCVLNIGIGAGTTVTGFIALILATVGISAPAIAAVGALVGPAVGYAVWEISRAYDRASVNDWGIRTHTFVHYIYPWTILGYLTSWVTQYLVWFDYSIHEWLPNSYVTGIIFTGIGVNALILSGIQAMILAEGIKNSWIPWNTWVWAGPYFG